VRKKIKKLFSSVDPEELAKVAAEVEEARIEAELRQFDDLLQSGPKSSQKSGGRMKR
jgi:hypothetical protein